MLLLPKPQAQAGTACSLREPAGRGAQGLSLLQLSPPSTSAATSPLPHSSHVQMQPAQECACSSSMPELRLGPWRGLHSALPTYAKGTLQVISCDPALAKLLPTTPQVSGPPPPSTRLQLPLYEPHCRSVCL